MTLYIRNLRPQQANLDFRLPEKTQLFRREISAFGMIALESLSADEEAAVIKHLENYGGRSLSNFVGARNENKTVRTPFVYHNKPITDDTLVIGADLVRDTNQQIANEQIADSTAKVVKMVEQKTKTNLKDGTGVTMLDENGQTVSQVVKG